MARVPAELKDRRPLVLVYQGASELCKADAVWAWKRRDYEVYVIERPPYFDVWRALHPRSGPISKRGHRRASASRSPKFSNEKF